jgi:hypothetical protein
LVDIATALSIAKRSDIRFIRRSRPYGPHNSGAIVLPDRSFLENF